MNRATRNRFQPCLEALEARELRAGGLSTLGLSALTSTSVLTKSILTTDHVHAPTVIAVTKTDLSAVSVLLSPAVQVPQLSSFPGSAHTLYLNFVGDNRADWFNIDYGTTTEHHYKNVQMGVFDTDGTPNSFSGTEKQQITEIWARVAEAYAPYDVNVTTIDPGNLSNGKALMVDIGKSNNWLGSGSTGISSIGSFSDGAPNVVFDFCDKIGSYLGGPNGPLDTANNPNFVMQVANTAIHESGHGFGLLHDRTYNADHTVQNEYDPGSGNWTPFMGDNLTSARHTWTLGIVDWNGNTPVLQWEPGKLGSILGYRADDFGDDIASATGLTFNVGGTATVKGVIGYHAPTFLFEGADVDVFKFTSRPGSVSVEADVLGYTNGAVLEPRIELWSSQGMIAAATAPIGSNPRLTANVGGGAYYVKVMSAGGLTDVGQYTLTISRPLAASLSSILTSKQFHLQDAIGGTSGAVVGGDTLAQNAAPFVPATLVSNLDTVASAVGLIAPGQAARDADVATLATLARDGKLPVPVALTNAVFAADVASGVDTTSPPPTLDALFAGTDSANLTSPAL